MRGGGDEESEDEGILARMEKMLDSQGRSYGEVITGKTGETLSTAFFDFTVSEVKAAEELDEYKPQSEGHRFIVAEVSVKNTTDQIIPVGNYDFSILWESEEEIAEEDQYPYKSFMEGMYPDDTTLNPGDTLSGSVVFEIPSDISDFAVVYDEVYDDEFEGDSYMVECKL